MEFLIGITVLLLCQLVGEIIVLWVGLPVPGPVVGMLLLLLTLAPKSVTAPVAMGISQKIGGLPSLTAVLVVLTGVLGAVFGARIFSLLGITDDSIKGISDRCIGSPVACRWQYRCAR